MGMYPTAEIIVGIPWEYGQEDTFEMIKEHFEENGKKLEAEDMYDLTEDGGPGVQFFYNGMSGEGIAIGISLYRTDYELINLDPDRMHPERIEKDIDIVDMWLHEYLGVEREPKLLLYGDYS